MVTDSDTLNCFLRSLSFLSLSALRGNFEQCFDRKHCIGRSTVVVRNVFPFGSLFLSMSPSLLLFFSLARPLPQPLLPIRDSWLRRQSSNLDVDGGGMS